MTKLLFTQMKKNNLFFVSQCDLCDQGLKLADPYGHLPLQWLLLSFQTEDDVPPCLAEETFIMIMKRAAVLFPQPWPN